MSSFPIEAVEAAVGRVPVRWIQAAGGYTPAERWLVTFADASKAFVKSAAGDEAWPIRREMAVLKELRGGFSPVMLGASDQEDRATLAVEDLSGGHWPPPYPADVSPLLDALDHLAEHPVPEHVPALEKPARPWWPQIGADPTAFLGLGLCTTRWLDIVLQDLVAAERSFDPTGDDLVHNDLWSGNLTMVGERCVFVDWAEARRGSRWLDRGFAYLSLRSEGGPVPSYGFPDDIGFAAWWAGSLAVRLTGAPDARLDPSITAGLLQDLGAALRWLAELMEIPLD